MICPTHWPRWMPLGFSFTLWYLDCKTGEAVVQGSHHPSASFTEIVRYPVTIEVWL